MQKYQNWRTARLTSIPRSFWYSLAFACAFLGIYGGWLLTQNVAQLSPVQGDTATTLGALASFVITWIGVKRSRQKQRADAASLPLERRLHFWIPLVFGIVLLFQALGNSIFIVYDWLGIVTIPIWGLIAIVGMYPVLLAGILLLPRDALGRKTSLRLVMESVILIVAIFTFSWYFLLGPVLLQRQGEMLLGLVLTAAFPIFDLLVVSCLILFSRSTVDQSLRTPIRALSLAVVIFVLTDSILNYQLLHGRPSSLLTLGWIVGNFAIALSIQAMRWSSASQLIQKVSKASTSDLVAAPIWRSLLSYALLPAVIGLVFYLWGTNKDTPLAIGTYACSLLLLVLIFTKQLVAIREIHGLNRGFQQLQHVIDEKNIALEQANAHLEALATTDPLTELPNHRALVTALDHELARSQQYQRSCSLLFFDLDHFKALNDGYGHAGGDIALHEFGALLRTTLPQINTVGRWGGEEFIAILPEQDITEAAIVADEIRSAVASRSFTVGGGMHLTCSIGAASSPAHGLQPEKLLQAADSAMYGAKRLGRNQVRRIDDPAVVALLATNSTVEGRDELTLIGTVHALAMLVEKRDVETGEHAHQVGDLLLLLARSLDLSEAEAQLLSLAGQLHDVGKIVIPDSILQKQEPLTEQELAWLHRHPQVGAEVVSSIPSLRTLAPIIRAHHEWWNGMGYPDQLAGDAIPFGARLLSIVDAYVIMTTKRLHGEAHEHQWVLAELRRGANTQFDPAIVEPFLLLLATMQDNKVAMKIG